MPCMFIKSYLDWRGFVKYDSFSFSFHFAFCLFLLYLTDE